jgi:hypothetical protein
MAFKFSNFKSMSPPCSTVQKSVTDIHIIPHSDIKREVLVNLNLEKVVTKSKSDASWFLQQGTISRELFVIYQAGELLTDSSFGQWLWCIDCRGI